MICLLLKALGDETPPLMLEHDEPMFDMLSEEVADPVTNVDLKDSIQSALSGYDIVRGAPLNVYAGESYLFSVVLSAGSD